MQRKVRRAKRKYLNDVICPQLHENPKRFWSYIKSKRNESTRVASLRNTDGLLYNDSQTQANILNNQFKSAYTIEDTNTIPVLHGNDHPVINKIHLTTNGVRKLLEGIKTHKATGPDNIPAHLLHILSHQLAPFLTRLFQFSLDSGRVPTDWKTANIIHIFKKGDRHKPSNYRPVSLTSICCKLLEHSCSV